MDKIRILVLSKFYPLAMASYFLRALRMRDDVDVKTVGYYSGQYIPWMQGMNLPIKYAIAPDLPLPNDRPVVSWEATKAAFICWKPDMVLTIDAGVRFDKKPDIGQVVHVATDPHVIVDSYDIARVWSDRFYNMQNYYIKPGDIYLPYAFDTSTHYAEPQEKIYDCALIGLPYLNRIELVQTLRERGITVAFKNGPIFDEYREINNQAKIGLNFSSLKDMTARVFELMAMGLAPVINRVPDLELFFEDGKHYAGFDTVSDAVAQVEALLKHPDRCARLSAAAYANVWQPDESGFPQHSYSSRVNKILVDGGLV